MRTLKALSTIFVTPPSLDSKTEHYISTVAIVLAFLVSVKLQRASENVRSTAGVTGYLAPQEIPMAHCPRDNMLM